MANDKDFDGETQVTEDITVYAVGHIESGVAGEAGLNYDYGSPITANLDDCMKEAYKSVSPEGNFTYEITDQSSLGDTKATIESGIR